MDQDEKQSRPVLVRLTQEEYAQLEARAARLDRSLGYVVREAVVAIVQAEELTKQ